MIYLFAVSLLWAFSFGLIKGRLGGIDAALIAAIRMGLATLVFLPLLRLRGISVRLALQLTALGAVQFGLMYLAYNESFRHLAAYEVALLTLTTPVFVTLAADFIEGHFRPLAFAAALLAVAGASVVVWRGTMTAPALRGALLVQASNLAFALGTVGYRRIKAAHPTLSDKHAFALPCAGAFALTAIVAALNVDFAACHITSIQWLVLIYLGVLASAGGFFLWNLGATRASAGTVAVMNNAKIPLAVACSLLFFGESADLPRLTASLGLMGAAAWLAQRDR